MPHPSNLITSKSTQRPSIHYLSKTLPSIATTSTELKKILEIMEADKRDAAQQMKAMQDQIQELILSVRIDKSDDLIEINVL
ncbi:hypothetical protein Tco_0974509 [Tanacetum coccineum]|uniref:Ty3-gypsy retrotransposon protein n=1 Tax=Tanacetum coccineum TaxID=301880 RepID=A0ABQ5EBV8_9ASTR